MQDQAQKQDRPDLPSIFEEAIKKVIYNVVQDAVRTVFEHVRPKPEKKDVPTFFGMEICEAETGLAKSTIYRNTSKNLMPHYRRDGKLIFKRDEIYAWMTENRVTTQGEFSQELDSRLINKKNRK